MPINFRRNGKMYFKYFKSVCKHRWFVFIECCKIGIPMRGLLHDLSKFRPSEFIPYAKYFYGGQWLDWDKMKHFPGFTGWKYTKQGVKEAFDRAWLMHQKRNPHHWQYWILQNDQDGVYALDMSYKYICEMFADWIGAGKAYTGKDNVEVWYEANKGKMILSASTRKIIERMIEEHIVKRDGKK